MFFAEAATELHCAEQEVEQRSGLEPVVYFVHRDAMDEHILIYGITRLRCAAAAPPAVVRLKITICSNVKSKKVSCRKSPERNL